MPTTGTNSSAAHELLAAIERVTALDALSAEAIGRALGVTMTSCERNNRFFNFFEAQLEGVAARAEYKEPGEGATSKVRILTIDLGPETLVSQSEMEQRFDAAGIGQVMPRAEPEGLVSIDFTTSGATSLSANFTANSKQLRSITLRQD